MAAKKRSPAQIEMDRVKISKMYLSGQSQATIAIEMGMTPPMVNYDLKAIRKAWLESSLVDFDTAMAETLAKIDLLEATYWDAWHRSKAKAEKATTQISTTAEGIESTVQTLHEMGQVGNPSFLAGVERCIDKRIKIFGLEAPLKVDWREALPPEFDPDEVEDQFTQLMVIAANATQVG